MFGYVRPNLADMPETEQQRYRSHYCGLCHAIGARHGQLARMALTFDLTYLTIFLGSLYEPEENPDLGHYDALSELTLGQMFGRYIVEAYEKRS